MRPLSGNVDIVVTGPSPQRPPLTISVAQAAQLLGVGESAVYSAIKREEIQAIRVGKLIRVMRAPLLEMLGLPDDYEI